MACASPEADPAFIPIIPVFSRIADEGRHVFEHLLIFAKERKHKTTVDKRL